MKRDDRRYDVVVIPGDGIGPELTAAAWEEIVGAADTGRAAAAGAFGPNTGWRADVGYTAWQDQSRAARLAGAAIRHNAMHMGEAITVRGQAGFGLGI